ncbi:MAG: hypothetical protein HZB38_14160 [Planctomycetes bacterium]|nr:hypothetical protein [Planctomycetota bacterium]
MRELKLSRLTLAAFAVLVLYGPIATAQECASVWTSLRGRPNYSRNWYSTLVPWDDGSGPALFIGGPNSLSRWNGTTWTQMSVGGGNPIHAAGLFDDGTGLALYLGTERGLYRWNGVSVTQLSYTGSSVFSIVRFTDANGPAFFFSSFGEVYRYDGATTTRIAYAPARWGPSALAVFDGGTGPALYFGGAFTTVDGTTARGLAEYDGTNWSEVGGGIGGVGYYGMEPGITALAVIDEGAGPRLFVGGWCTEIGGQPGSIARWDGQNWERLGVFVNQDKYVGGFRWLDTGGGPAVHVCGDFDAISDDSVTDLARWDGQHWRPVGGGIPYTNGAGNYINAIEQFDAGDGLKFYAVRQFSSGGGTNFVSVMRYGCVCPDRDGDNLVGLSDLSLLLTQFGLSSGADDIDGDADVDMVDLALLLSLFGEQCP